MLENLVQVQCIALVTDLNDSDALVIKIFELFYRMVGKNKGIDLDYLMTSILSQLLQEMDIIPPRVVDIIISHFLSKPPESTQKDNHSLPVSPGYIVSKTICTDNVDVMTRHVNQYFADIMSISLDEELEEEMEKSEKGGRSKQVEKGKSAQIKAQELAVQIWIAAPELLVNIIGQLEQDLSVDNLKVRDLATASIGKMLGYAPSRVNFVKEHFTTWKAWLGRIKDKSPQIRITWTKALPDIIKNRTDIIPEICLALADRLNDPDEKVRLISCSVFGELKSSVVATKLNNETLFNALYSRLRDKKPLVRQEAFAVIGSLYENAYSQIELGNQDYISLFGPIPQKILDQLLLNDKEVNERIDITLNENIFITNADDTARTIRFLTVLNSLNEQGMNAFNAILKRQFTLVNYVGALATMIREYNGNNDADPRLKSRIDGTIKWLSNSFADPAKAEASLQIFFEKATDRACKLLSATVNPESDFNVVQRAIKDLYSEIKGYKVPTVSSVLHTFTIIFYRSSYSILNHSCISPIVQVTRDPSSKLHHTAQTFLKTISASQPTLMKSHVHDLISMIENGKPGFDGSVDTLKAANSLAEKFQELIPQEASFFSSLVTMALEGSPEEATQSVRLISFAEKKEFYFNEVIVVATELSIDNPKLPTYIASIAELYSCSPDLIETKHQEIQSFLTQQVLLANTTKASESDPEWVEDENMDQSCQSKILALHVLVNRLKHIADPEVTKELSKPVFSLLASLIGNMGEIVRPSSGVTPLHYRARLRLESGLLLLELALNPNIENLIRPNEIIKMASLVQDGVFQIRQRFLHTLMQYWSEEKIPRRFVTLVFVTAFEPNNELLYYVSTWIRARVAFEYKSQLNRMPMEKTFATLLHLLVHHEESFEELDPVPADNESGQENAADKEAEDERIQLKQKQTLDYVLKTAAYIVFYLSAVATEENISMIFYISQRVKQYRDNVDEALSDRLYLVSDIAQFIIIKYQEFKGWSVDTWPGRLQLSADVFKPMPSVQVAQNVAKTTYLPDYTLKDLEEFLRKRFAKLRKQHAELAVKSEDSGVTKDGKDSDQPTKKRAKSGSRRSSARKQADGGDSDDADGYSDRNGNSSRRSSGRPRKRKGSDDESDSSEYGASGKRRKSVGFAVTEESQSSRRRSTRLASSSTSKSSFKEDTSDEDMDDEEEEEDDEEMVDSEENEEESDEDQELKTNGGDNQDKEEEEEQEEEEQEPEKEEPKIPAKTTKPSPKRSSKSKAKPETPKEKAPQATGSRRSTRSRRSLPETTTEIETETALVHEVDDNAETENRSEENEAIPEEDSDKDKENIENSKTAGRRRGRPARKGSAEGTAAKKVEKPAPPAPTRVSRRRSLRNS